MGVRAREGGLRRRMPLRRAGGGAAAGGSGGAGGRAMRYYRLWIYTCNTALLAGALAFAGAAAKTLLLDFRRALVPQLSLYQPSFLYACLALLAQGGALQLLGCVAALRLSERLLNAYWLLLLVLLFGDVVLGAFWAFRFERVCQELRPALRARLHQEYGTDGRWTQLWDRLQAEDACCGVVGPEEFVNGTGRFEMPPSCCAEPALQFTQQQQQLELPPPAAVQQHEDQPAPQQQQDQQVLQLQLQVQLQQLQLREWQQQLLQQNGTGPSVSAGASAGAGAGAGGVAVTRCARTHASGCDERLLGYLRATASTLAILGYCVLAFLKLCFLGILRYEIREMIQKIRILRSELELPGVNGAVPGALRASDGGVGGGAGGGAESERESLLVRPESAALLSSPPAGPKNPNGNNNYELREYRGGHDNI